MFIYSKTFASPTDFGYSIQEDQQKYEKSYCSVFRFLKEKMGVF